jgi:diaminopimelate decarboxylase
MCVTLQALFASLRSQFPHLKYLDLGGGLGVPYRPLIVH